MTWFRRITSVVSPVFSIGWRVSDLVTRGLQKLLNSNVFDNLLRGVTGTALTDADKEKLELETDAQSSLNQEEYERKLDFYQRFESPQAQVRQYKEAGFNPMTLAGSGAGASASGGIGSAGSAGSADAGSGVGAFVSLLSGILNFATRQQEIKNQFELGREANQIRMSQADALNGYYRSLTAGQENNNRIFNDVWQVTRENIEADTRLKSANIDNIKQLFENNKVQHTLLEKGVRIADIDIVSKQYQQAVFKAQADNADKYYKAAADLQFWTAEVQRLEGNFLQATAKKRVQGAIAEFNSMIIRAGMDAKIFTGEGFNREVEGKMTPKDKWEMWTDVGSSVIGTALGLAVPYVAASAGAKFGAGRALSPLSGIPSWLDKSMLQGGLSAPYQYRQF